MASSSVQLSVVCDSSPFVLFASLFKAQLEGCEQLSDLGNLGFELFRIESDHGSAPAGKLVVRLYPSDRLLRFAATALADDFDLAVIE